MREIDARLGQVRGAFREASLASWLDSNGLDRARDRLQEAFDDRLRRALPRFTASTLPTGLREEHARFVADRLDRLDAIVATRVAQLVKELDVEYRRRIRGELRALLRAHDYGAAEQLVASCRRDPLQCLDEDARARRGFPADKAPKLEGLMAHIARDRADIVRAARARVEEWRTAIQRELARGEEQLQAGFARAASRRLESARSLLSGELPWRSLPTEVRDERRVLQRRLDDLARGLVDLSRRQDLAALAVLEDSLHELLYRRVDFEQANVLLGSYHFDSAEVRALEVELRKDIDLVRSALEWLVEQLDGAFRNKRRAWQLRTERLDAKLVGIKRGYQPALEFSTRTGSRTLGLAEFDRVALVNLVSAQHGFEAQRKGLGLYQFYGDRFDEAQLHMPNHRLGRLIPQRERRRDAIKRRGRDRESQARIALEHLRSLARIPGRPNLAALETTLADFEKDFVGTALLISVRAELKDLRASLVRRRAERQLRAQLPAALRNDADLEIDTESRAIRVSLPFARKERFAAGLGRWVKHSGGLAIKADKSARDELQAALVLEIPPIAAEREVVVSLRFAVAEERALALLVLDVCGSRVLLGDVPGKGTRLLGDPGRNPLAALPKLAVAAPLADGARLVEGGHYVLRLRLGPARNLARDATLSLNGIRHAGISRLQTPHRAPSRVRIAALGGCILESLEINASSRQ